MSEVRATFLEHVPAAQAESRRAGQATSASCRPSRRGSAEASRRSVVVTNDDNAHGIEPSPLAFDDDLDDVDDDKDEDGDEDDDARFYDKTTDGDSDDDDDDDEDGDEEEDEEDDEDEPETWQVQALDQSR